MTLKYSQKVVFGATAGPSISQRNNKIMTQNPSQKKYWKKLPKMFWSSPSKLGKAMFGVGETLVSSFTALLQHSWKSDPK